MPLASHQDEAEILSMENNKLVNDRHTHFLNPYTLTSDNVAYYYMNAT